MRILFFAQTAPGHLIPLMPLQRAAAAAGHETAVMTGAEVAHLVGDAPLLTVGPTMDEIMAETIRRPRGGDPSQPGPGAIEIFGGTTVDLTFDDALREGTAFAPDLIVTDPLHYTAQLLAAALDVPWAAVEISGALPPELVAALDARADEQFAARSLTGTAPIARVDPYPAVLHGAGWTAPADRVGMRPTAFGSGYKTTPAAPARTRPAVLVTLGTSIYERDGDPLPDLLAAVLGRDVDVVLTDEPSRLPAGTDPARVRAVGFVPLAELLPAVDVVVSAGGTGTVLAALAAGRPMVIRPVKADQPFNAQRAAALGCAVVVDDATDTTTALARVLDDPAYAERARAVADEIATEPGPAQVLAELLRRAGTTKS